MPLRGIFLLSQDVTFGFAWLANNVTLFGGSQKMRPALVRTALFIVVATQLTAQGNPLWVIDNTG